MSEDAVTETLAAAERVAEVLSHRGIPVRLIGASALAVHGYPRATRDIDLALNGLSLDELRGAVQDLVAAGFDVSLGEPDLSDPLGGLIRVKLGGEFEIDLVNFGNPWTGAGRRLGALIFAEPGVGLQDVALEAVGLVPLVLLKLFAGGRLDLRDAAELVSIHPELNLEELRRRAAEFSLEAQLTRVLEDAVSR